MSAAANDVSSAHTSAECTWSICSPSSFGSPSSLPCSATAEQRSYALAIRSAILLSARFILCSLTEEGAAGRRLNPNPMTRAFERVTGRTIDSRARVCFDTVESSRPRVPYPQSYPPSAPWRPCGVLTQSRQLAQRADPAASAGAHIKSARCLPCATLHPPAAPLPSVNHGRPWQG